MIRKTLSLLTLLILMVIGCVSLQTKDCQQLESLFFKDDSCSTGWSVPGITGHPPSCLSEEDCNKIKEECPNF